MRSRMVAKAEKRIITIMLSLMMVAGAFTGMKLDVKAAREIHFEDLKVGETVYADDTIIKSASSGGNKLILLWNDPYRPETSDTLGEAKNDNGDPLYVTVFPIFYEGKKYTTFKCTFINENTASFDIIVENEDDTSIKKEHVCKFEWITTLDPTTGADGLEEYKCAGCGLVKESHPIPASVAAVKDFYGNVKEAPENGSITYDSGKLYTISDYLLKKMSERSDVTVTVNFEYQNAKYEITFPAGTDYTSVLTDEETMYGYFGVAAKLGLTVTAN